MGEKKKPSVESEMLRLLNVFLSIESTAATSLLSTYSMSGLLKESQEDIDSSVETDIVSDLLGETSTTGAGTVTVATGGGGVGGASFFTGKELAFGKIAALVGLTFANVGLLFPEHAGTTSFLVLANLAAHGT